MNKYVIKRTPEGEYYFTLSAKNGAIICRSNTYASEAGALNGIESVRANAYTDVIEYEDKSAKKSTE